MKKEKGEKSKEAGRTGGEARHEKAKPQSAAEGAEAAKAAQAGLAAPAGTAGTGQPASSGPDMNSVIKEAESAMFAIRFYPVAVNEQSKKEAVAKLEAMYAKGSETVRQMLLYMIHESLATSTDLKVMHTFEYFKMKNPTQDSAQQRMSVYRAIFNYNTSLEGLIELVRMLGRLKGSDDSAKLLTYHFSHLCAMESEASHLLRGAIVEALGECESRYALNALLDYARYTDSERMFNRIVGALSSWEGKLDKLKMDEKERAETVKMLKELSTSEFGGSHYG